MKRHWNREVSPAEHVVPGTPGKVPEPARQRRVSRVLHPLYEHAQRAVVGADCPDTCDGATTGPLAVIARGVAGIEEAPRGQ